MEGNNHQRDGVRGEHDFFHCQMRGTDHLEHPPMRKTVRASGMVCGITKRELQDRFQ
jgi:hypothetical protein